MIGQSIFKGMLHLPPLFDRIIYIPHNNPSPLSIFSMSNTDAPLIEAFAEEAITTSELQDAEQEQPPAQPT